MFSLAIAIDYSAGLPLVVCAGVAMYVASKALADALVGGRANMPGRLAIGQWLPIAVLTVAAAVSHRQAMAMGLIFSTAVACLSLATGAVGFMGVGTIPATVRRSWAMLVPAGLLAFFAGFRASVSCTNAGILAVEGLCVLLLWNDRTDPNIKSEVIPPAGRGILFRLSQIILGLLLTAVGAWFAMHGLDRVAAGSEFASTGLLTATLLSPLLVLPIIGTGAEMAQRNQSVTAISSQVGVALLNTCALLPLVVVASSVEQMIAMKSMSVDHLISVPFPLSVWRVDVLILIALGLFLLPVAIGRWSITKTQGLALMLGYALYLGLTIIVGVQRV